MSTNEQNNLNTQPNLSNESSEGGFDLHKILFILYSHKWKILILSSIGLMAALGVYLAKDSIQKPLYMSQAKLLVRYVVEAVAVDQVDIRSVSENRYRSFALNNEIAILNSWDLKQEIAEEILKDEKIKLKKFLPNSGRERITNAEISMAINNQFEVGLDWNTSIINFSYSHSDPEIAPKMLNIFIEKYFKKHLKTHRANFPLEIVEREIFEIKESIKSAEGSISDLMSGIVSIADEQKRLSNRKQKLDEELVELERALAIQKLRVEKLPVLSEPQDSISTAVDTLQQAQPDINDIEKLKSLISRLEILNNQKIQHNLVHKPESNKIKVIQQQIDLVENEKANLIEKFPALIAVENSSNSTITSINPLDPNIEKSRLLEIEYKISSLKEEQQQIDLEIKQIAQIANDVKPHQRKKEVAEARLKTLENAKTNAERDLISKEDMAGLPNIILMQSPTPAFPVISDEIKKVILALALSGLALGVGIAFVIEIFLDRSVKHPDEFEARLHIPLMLSIPQLSEATNEQMHTKMKFGKSGKRFEFSTKNGNEILSEIKPWDPNHFIHPFTGAMRDRLASYFQMDQIKDNELLAVTGFSKGVGASTIACSLAASFAEIDKKVLYINLNEDGFFTDGNGEPETDEINNSSSLLNRDFKLREKQGNLIMMSINFKSSNAKNRSVTPKKIYELITELKSSDFEHIVFDMPPLGTTSPTLAMAGFMNKVVVIVDSGKTNREILKRNYKELVSRNSNIFVILNKANKMSSRLWS